MSSKNISSLCAQTAFLSIRGTMPVPCIVLWLPPLLERLFYFMFFSLFTASILTPGFLPGGKDKLRGIAPSLPAAASRFLIDAESGRKQSLGERGGRRKEQCPFQSHGGKRLRQQGFAFRLMLRNGVCMYEQN